MQLHSIFNGFLPGAGRCFPARIPALMAGVILAAASCAKSYAEVKPCALFSDNAVLQRGMAVPVWGTARPGENVTVEFGGQSVTATAAADGKWMVKLRNLEADGPDSAPKSLIMKGDNTVEAKNVLVGEVWLCSGQSNMARTLVPPESVQPRRPYWETAAAAANFPQIRHFRVGGRDLDAPTTEVSGKWEICTPESARGFTSVGYFFARDLYTALKVPVGLINSSVGATGAASWVSEEMLAGHPELQKILDRRKKEIEEFPQRLEKYKTDEARLLSEWEAAVAKAKQENKPEPRKPAAPGNPATNAYRPTAYYNGKIACLQPYAIRGVLWYQGESNSGHAREYTHLFGALINGWRKAWGQGDFPFLFVQLPDYRGTPPEFRETQLLIWQNTPNTGMVVTTDAGDPADIHPPNKEPVGQRLAIFARGFVYGQNIVYSGPVYDSFKVEGNQIILTYKHAGSGLMAKDGELKGFLISGRDRKFAEAKAEIKGETIVVSCDQVPEPTIVRYNWDNVPKGNLYNKEGLPASPFRTDVDMKR
ncbi:MAG: sialate O-acetylesterase [Candidatus Methylacidiphilales bacterium]|nr:sialate O-acetylesterase [Candidatus Methylacidiphilales bacterium]